MRKGVIKIIVLAAVFLVTAALVSVLTHKNNIDLTSKMEEATLPVVYLQTGETQINELYGYTSEMDGTAMRDTITPLSEDLSLPVTIRSFQNQIESISYEVRTMDMERLMEEGSVDSFSQKDGEILCSLQFQNLLEKETEYVLILHVESDGKPVYYYTRIMREKDYFIAESLEFVMNFHEQTFDKEHPGGLATYLEPNEEGDNTTLQKVTIHSSLKQVTWGDFVGERLSAPIPSIKEMGSSYNTIVLQYVITSSGDNGEVEYYNVEEYYRVRYGSANSRMYLLNYERTMNQIFRGENGAVGADTFSLGVRSENVHYMSNEKGTVIAFVQEGELWSYSSDNHQLSRVYSFLGTEGIGDRENNPQHQIQIIKIDETGSMDFVVYGYMNRGSHEGKTGIAVFHYDSVGNTTEEELFIPSDKSYEMLKAEWGELFYVSDGNIFYILADNLLYRIDLYTRETEKLIQGLERGSYAVSEDGRFIAWQESDSIYSADSLKIMDLEGEEVRTIEAGAGEYLQPVGFVETDFIYGVAKAEDVISDAAGNTMFPMYKIVIVDEKSDVVRDYQKDGYYIEKAYVENETIFLNRATRNGAGYAYADQDTIKNQQIESSRRITVETAQHEKKQCQVYLSFAENISDGSRQPQVTVPKELLVEENRTVALEKQEGQEVYYVYSGGKIVMSSRFVAEAVGAADESLGVVIGDNQKYIWRRGRRSSQPVVGEVTIDTAAVSSSSIARSLTALLKTEGISMDVDGLLSQGETPKQILTEALSDKQVIDLTGCSVEQTLYYVNMGTPVFGMVNGEAYLIVGYDEYNTILYNPETNTTQKMGLQDSSTMFGEAGNMFLGYIE